MNDGNTGKLVPFRDRTKRQSARTLRRRSDGPRRAPGDGGTAVTTERLWLARALWGVAAYEVLYWIAIATGVLSLDGHQDLRQWTVSLVLSDLVVATFSVLAALELVRDEETNLLFPRLAAGGLIAICCARIGRAAAASFLRDLEPSERLEIVAVVGCLLIGLWVISHSYRLRLGR